MAAKLKAIQEQMQRPEVQQELQQMQVRTRLWALALPTPGPNPAYWGPRSSRVGWCARGVLPVQAVMANPQLQQRMQALRDDPEFADFFKEVQSGGMQVSH